MDSHYRQASMKVLAIFVALSAAAFGSTIPRLDGRIIGGVDANIEDYPYQVSVRIYDHHVCGGSILDENTILTAAHCTYGNDHGRFSIRVGHAKHNEGRSYTVAEIRPNTNYTFWTFDYDVCILKLATPLDMSASVQPIELHPTGVVNHDVVWVSGWGVTGSESRVPVDSLRAVDIQVITSEECTARYAVGRITSRMFCAQTVGHDVCQGDSGGPVVMDGTLVGIVSWGYGCASPMYPGVYTDVYSLTNWIESNRY